MLDIRTDDDGEFHLALDERAARATLDRWLDQC
jgi:hypothetical protein